MNVRRREIGWALAVAALLAVGGALRLGGAAWRGEGASGGPGEARSPVVDDGAELVNVTEVSRSGAEDARTGAPVVSPVAAPRPSAPVPTASGAVPPTLPVPGARWVTPGGYAMRYVPPPPPAGTFDMGDEGTPNAPIHSVVLSRGFWLGETEASGSHSWCDAVALANDLSEREGLRPAYPGGCALGEPPAWDRGADGYRLPTEAEWEWAARAGRAGAFWTQQPPGPHPYGLLLMQSGRWEWVWDRFGAYPTAGWAIDPAGPDAPSPWGDFRVARGRIDNVAYRAIWPDDLRDPLLGVRWVRPP